MAKAVIVELGAFKNDMQSVLFSAKNFFKPDLLILFAAFVEMFLTIDRRPALVLNANYIIGDQFINNTRWTPTDEE